MDVLYCLIGESSPCQGQCILAQGNALGNGSAQPIPDALKGQWDGYVLPFQGRIEV